ncbi:MAG: CBM9 family sugar-binding protein [Thiotrichaceae bacterium]|nr:CBM9 family sugar-binding protein [Thiotrichaceae bacterium]
MDIYLSRTLKTIVIILFLNINILSAQTNNSNLLSPLGMNTNEALEVDSSIPFVDLFRLALPFSEARPWFTRGKVYYDSKGWPKNLQHGQAGTRFLSHIPPDAIPSGNYSVLYKGDGEITYGGSVKLVKRLPGKDIIRFEPMKNGLLTATLIIKKTNPKNHLREIRIIMPGGICQNAPFQRVHDKRNCKGRRFLSFERYHQQIVFNPQYLTFMKDFKVLRFMNMSGITRNNIQHWKNRPTVDKATWGGKEGVRGVPVEIMIKLANTINANAWFNMPHKANDPYINRFAMLVKKKLKPSLKIYIEYTNEAWNNVFVPQAEHMKQTGSRRRLDKNRNIAGAKFYSLQSVRIFKMWERVLGKHRLIRVMGSSTTDLSLSQRILAYKNAYRHVDVLAIAPYFHIDQNQVRQIRSVHKVFQLLNDKKNRYSIDSTIAHIQEQADIAKKYGVQLVAYEGGQHLVQSKTHSIKEGANPYLIKANKHPMMARAYLRLLAGWKRAGGTLFVAFSAPRTYTWHGSWGVKEHIAEPNYLAPKYRALISFKNGNRCWWKGCTARTVSRLRKPAKIDQRLALGRDLPPRQPHTVTIRKQGRNKNGASLQRLSTLINGSINDPRDLAAAWNSTWDDENLYVWVNIQDDKHVKDSKKAWADDSVEIYIDADASRLSSYDGKNDFQFTYRLYDRHLSLGGSPLKLANGITHKMVKVKNGYQLATAIPWSTLKVRPTPGKRIGFDVQVNDDDTGRSRDGKIAWNANSDKAWKNPQMFGQLVLMN